MDEGGHARDMASMGTVDGQSWLERWWYLHTRSAHRRQLEAAQSVECEGTLVDKPLLLGH